MMTTNDPIADMLTRLRNAQMARLSGIRVPYSNMKFAISKILEREGYVANVQTVEVQAAPFKELVIALKYTGKMPAMRELKRVSKPGRRVYAPADGLPRVYSDLGIAIVSTSGGVMTNKEARKRRLGGEILCEIF